MGGLLIRLVLVLGFVAYMAAVYLVLHMIFSRFIRSPQSPVLWFFGIVTRPLTAPIRAVVPGGTSEQRVRLIALAAYAVVWLLSKGFLAMLRGSAAGPGMQ